MSWEEVIVATLEAGQRRGMVGPGDVRQHLEHATRVAATLESPEWAVDLGSGAGIPGLVLAGIWPESRWVLVDAARRRTRLLEEAIAELTWGARVTIEHARAELVGRDPLHRHAHDLVTARAFGPPAVTAECAAPLLRVGGMLAVTEPPEPEPERWSPGGLAALGLELRPSPPGVQHMVLARPSDDRYPRRPGVPERRPLW